MKDERFSQSSVAGEVAPANITSQKNVNNIDMLIFVAHTELLNPNFNTFQTLQSILAGFYSVHTPFTVWQIRYCMLSVVVL